MTVQEVPTMRREGPTDQELKLSNGRAGGALLMWLERLAPEKVAKMRRGVARNGGRAEQSRHFFPVELRHHESPGPLRTRTGFVYR